MSDNNYWSKLMGTDEGAADYMRSYGEGPCSPLRLYIADLINEGESVLDVGCGPGWDYDTFIEYGPIVSKYLGLDYSERFVRVANQRNPGQYKLGDVRKIDQPDESWDVVLLQDVLEHTQGYEKPVHEALRVARKRVLITFWHLTENDDHINDDGNDGWGAWYSKPKWEKFLDSTGEAWMADTIPRKGDKHDIYIIDKESGDV